MNQLIGIVSEQIVWFAVGSLLVFVLSIWAVSWLVISIPADYFLSEHCALDRFSGLPFWVRWTLILIKQFLGIMLIVVGMLMLIAPGQGLLTILAGIILLSFPGKRWLVNWLVHRRGVLGALNWIRRRADKKPLVVEP